MSGTAIITKVYYRLRHMSEAVFCAYKQSRERSETGVMLAYKHGSDRFRRATRTLGAKQPGSAYTGFQGTYAPCLHEGIYRKAYGEQREPWVRSSQGLLIQGSKKHMHHACMRAYTGRLTASNANPGCEATRVCLYRNRSSISKRRRLD